MRFQVVAVVFGLFRALANALASSHHEQRQVIALSLFRREYVIAQTQEVTASLPLESKRVQRFGTPWREQSYRVAFRLRLKKLPDRAHLHERCRFALHFFHALKQFQSFGVALREPFLEIAFEPQVA